MHHVTCHRLTFNWTCIKLCSFGRWYQGACYEFAACKSMVAAAVLTQQSIVLLHYLMQLADSLWDGDNAEYHQFANHSGQSWPKLLQSAPGETVQAMHWQCTMNDIFWRAAITMRLTPRAEA